MDVTGLLVFPAIGAVAGWLPCRVQQGSGRPAPVKKYDYGTGRRVSRKLGGGIQAAFAPKGGVENGLTACGYSGKL